MPFVAEHPDDLVARLAERLAQVRRERGITQEALAERLDTAERNVRRIESGQNITVRTLGRIAIALGVRVVIELLPDEVAQAETPPGRKRRLAAQPEAVPATALPNPVQPRPGARTPR